MNIHNTRILESDASLARHFMPHQVAWIQAEEHIHAQRKQAVALAEKSVRIGWTYADAFKNVRKRLWYKGRVFKRGKYFLRRRRMACIFWPPFVHP